MNTSATQTIATFEPGKSYTFGWIGDSEMKSTIKVIKRTAKFITFEYNGETIRRGVRVYDGAETIEPTGSYSMSPTCSAHKVVVEEAPTGTEIIVGAEFECEYHRSEPWKGVVLAAGVKASNGDTIIIEKLTGDNPRIFTTSKEWFNSHNIKIKYTTAVEEKLETCNKHLWGDCECEGICKRGLKLSC